MPHICVECICSQLLSSLFPLKKYIDYLSKIQRIFFSGFRTQNLISFWDETDFFLSERDLTEENDPLSVLCGKSCAEPNQHNRVWLETHRNCTLVQLCHQCHSNCQKNYRNDVSKHFASKRKGANAKDIRGVGGQQLSSNSIIWYRYFARYTTT